MLGYNVAEKLIGLDLGTTAFSSFCDEITEGIVVKKHTLLELLEQLESLLTHTDPNKRSVGLNVVSHVIKSHPRDLLSTTELDYLVKFFCNQLNTHQSLITVVLVGLNGLIQFPELSKLSLYHITSTLFSSVTWQTQIQGDRRHFYNILHFIIFNRIEDYKATSSEFLFNVISTVDGERDPRNLLILFTLLPKLFNSLPLGPLVEDAFEVVSCYFPIDFHQSSTEPGPVSKDDLVSALIPCLLAVPDFAILCISLIKEKLESTLKSAKIDSYNLLIAGCEVWPRDVLGEYSEALWADIKRDALPPRDTHVADLASTALQAVVKAVPEERLTDLVVSVIKNCEIFLSDVQLSLFEPASCLLFSVMEASAPACRIVALRMLPRFVALLQVTKGTSQTLILEKLSKFVQICLKKKIGFEVEEWTTLWVEVVKVAESETQTTWYVAYVVLSGVTIQLSVNDRLRLYPTIFKHIVDSSNRLARSSAIKCLQELATIYEEEVQLNVIEKMIVNEDSKDEITKDLNILEALFSVAAVAARFHQVMEGYFTRLVIKSSVHVSNVIALLRDLMEDVKINCSTALMNFIFYHSTIIPTLIDLDAGEQDLLNSSKIIQILVRTQSASEQIKAVQRFTKEISSTGNNTTKKTVLLEALLGPLWPEVVAMTLETVVNDIIPVAFDPEADPLARSAALALIASHVNKAEDDRLLGVVAGAALSASAAAAEVHASVTAALVTRGHPLADGWLDRLVAMLEEREGDVAQGAAEGLEQVMEKSQRYLNEENHCRVRLLYRQRVFHSAVPRLLGGPGRPAQLRALASLLRSVPRAVYSPHVRRMVPMLVKSLDAGRPELLLSTLGTLADLLPGSSELLQEHVDVFVRRFLAMSRESGSMHVRMAALRCLRHTLAFSPVTLMPYKPQVLFGLVPCLGDRKRLVRREAALCRSRWFLLGSPTDS